MKPKHLILTLLALLTSITASALEWADANGTVWNFNISGNNATLCKGWQVSCISGTIPNDLTIPAIVYNGSSPYTVTSIGECAFYNCSSLTSITIPEGVTSIGGYAFYGCSSLTSITIPEGVTSIGGYAFSGCSSLTTINIPEGVTSIGGSAFSGCSSLTTINIPEGVTSIGSDAFYGCSSLTSINIPDGVTSIGDWAFSGVEMVNIAAQTPPAISGSLGDNYTVFVVPASAKAAYRAAENWSGFATRIIGASEWNDATVNVTARDDGSGIQTVIGEANVEDVYSLKVNGTINGYDFMILRQKMPALRYLDLSGATIVANDYQYYTGYHSEDNIIGALAFYQTNLRSFKSPSGTTCIGRYAFSECKNLKEVILNEGLLTIGWSGFNFCSTLGTIQFPESLTEIGSYCFTNTSLKTVTLPKNLKTIGASAFKPCYSLTSIEFPEGIESIGSGAFTGCSSIKSVTVKTPVPLTISDDTFPTQINAATLYVPELATSKEKYYWANGWSGFLKHDEYSPKYDSFYLTEDYEVGDGKDQFHGVDEDTAPNADLRPQSGFIKEGEEDVQNLGDVDQDITGNGTGASIIAKDDGENTGNLDINNLNVKVSVSANTWYFFCFPYDVKVNECSYPGDYVWKEYQGLLRATTGKGWKTVEGNMLKAFEGYAFRTTRAGKLTITFHHPRFGGNRAKELAAYVCENIQNASWNFVGNPYSCYYDFQESDFTAPITVWNGSTYTAYTPGDDDYHLRPYEAFFVQKPSGTDLIGFNEERRETYQQSQKKNAAQAKARRERGLNPERLLMNLYISDNDTAIIDRTRVVLNERAQHAYELEHDAAKFLSTDAAAQLYSVDGTTQFAINERPSAGDIRLGYVAQKAGRLSIGAERMDQPMVLVDTQLGTTFDLSLGTYDFDTQAGTFDGRFLLRAAGDQTGLTALRKQTGAVIGTQQGGIAIGGAEGKTTNVYTIGGAQAAQHIGNGFIALKSGVYVVCVDGASAKVSVK